MIEEVDHWVGLMMDQLAEAGLEDNTLIVFTSDHGEMLGAHGMRNKFNMLEEATRVPMIMSMPGRMPANTFVKEPVSQIDIFATLLDYLQASEYDDSDGKSLRRFIEKKSWNEFYDERTVVVELDNRFPIMNANAYDGDLGGIPNFMIRKGNYKLILPRRANSDVIDMMYNLTGG